MLKDAAISMAAGSRVAVVATSPVTVIPAADDPVIPISDFYALRDLTPNLRVHIQPYGGHVGFVELFPFRLWSCEAINTKAFITSAIFIVTD